MFDENELRDIGYINLSKHKGLFEKAFCVKQRIIDLDDMYSIDRVVVEENLQAFRA